MMTRNSFVTMYSLCSSLIALQFYYDESFLNNFENDFQDLQKVKFSPLLIFFSNSFRTFGKIEVPEFGIGVSLGPQTPHFDNTALWPNFALEFIFQEFYQVNSFKWLKACHHNFLFPRYF